MAAGLADALSDPDAGFTVFAPTNDAFAALPQEILDAVLADVDLLTAVLLYHVAPEVLTAADLSTEKCGQTTVMLTETTTGTLCQPDGSLLQVGQGNTEADAPTIISLLSDIPACNSVIHAIDRVILPNLG